LMINNVLTSLFDKMQAHGDRENADKIKDLMQKLRSGKASLAFSGHFSAGKSSLINALCGIRLLPSGPIPTSANLVVIENGEAGATVVYHDDNLGQLYPRLSSTGQDRTQAAIQVEIDQIADYCKDGEIYNRIEIRYPSELLADRLRFLDTPGVDSTDEAHMLATESSLHLADAVFYVTDYNHVLSDMNLSFTKRLTDEGKPLYLIVNQIDKHRDEEITWEDYKTNVRLAFQDWGVQPKGFIFVSVKDPEHPNNEWAKLLWTINQQKAHSSILLTGSVLVSAKQIMKSHLESNFPAAESREMSLEEAERQLANVQQELSAVGTAAAQFRNTFHSELTKLIDNAQIMPATTRELADSYLQSRKPGFKVGLLFSNKKTQAEMASRLELFAARLKDHIEQQLVWHLNNWIKQWAEQFTGTSNIDYPITMLEAELDACDLATAVNESAAMSSAYTMTYCKLVTEQLKSAYRRKALSLVEPLFAHVEEENREHLNKLQMAYQEAQATLEHVRLIELQQTDKDLYISELQGLFKMAESENLQASWPNPDEADAADLSETSPVTSKKDESNTNLLMPLIESSFIERNKQTNEQHDHFQYRSMIEDTASSLRHVAELMRPARSLESVRTVLEERAAKLMNNRFTIALFGAFSAGKSSLTNALIGEMVLPVSPNPTTAAINSILPPDERHPHRTALIRMKTADALLDDLRFSLSMLGLKGDQLRSLNDLDDWMNQIETAHISAKGKPHLSFMKAVKMGYAEARDRLGTAWNSDFETYLKYVVEEDKACFVESIELYYQTIFSDQGVVFVDTPGADSIHARHTGVTFNYIKNADAIVFVTYYNHAFSQADKQFLLQLGRVKESFELDKMFFIVNAVDLAESTDELRSVLDYVEKQLLNHGIRNPRMFPVSSRNALEAKNKDDEAALIASGMVGFEQSFARFAESELTADIVRSAQAELVRATSRFRELIQLLEKDDHERQRHAEQMRGATDKLKIELQSLAMSSERKSDVIRQELAELLHHVKQRCYYRYGDLFNDAFHPSVLQEDGRDIGRALQSAWQQLQQSISVEVSQELLATTLRMENFTGTILRAWNQRAIAMIVAQLPTYMTRDWMPPSFQTPLIRETIAHLSTDEKMIRKLYKNAKFFFEGEGKASLKQFLESEILASLQNYIESHENELSNYYEGWLQASIYAEVEQLTHQLEQDVRLYSQQIEEKQLISELRNRLARIEPYLRTFERKA